MISHEKILLTARKSKIQIWDCFSGTSLQMAKLPQSLKNHELNALLLLSIEKPTELCRFLGISFLKLEKIINNPEYHHFEIPKKKGGTRIIESPSNNLKKIQKRLNYFFQAYYLWIKPKEIYGFVINPHYLGTYCNIAANAQNHICKKNVLNIDLKDFFPNISANRIYELFTSAKFAYNDQISKALSLLTTYNGKLPTGAPTSPVISNFICMQLDAELLNLSASHHLSYSRYADDITFSTNEQISQNLVSDIRNIIQKNNFTLNDKKIRLKSSGQKQTVTGITVNKKINVDRKLLKKIRAMLHDLTHNGLDSASKNHFQIKSKTTSQLHSRFISRLGGYIDFVGQVRGKSDTVYLRFKNEFDIFLENNRLI